MAEVIGEAVIKVRSDGSAVPGEVAKTGKKAGSSFASGFKGAIKGLVAAAGVAGVVAGAVGVIKGSIAEAREAIKVTAETRNTIRTTGGAANVTAKQVAALANAMSLKVGVDDEAIQHGANLILTFKNIRNEAGKGNDVFNRATQAAVDLAAHGFGDINSASKMLGRALNDPVKGLTALSRAGVTFDAKTAETITKLTEEGKLLQAQKIIMREVESQVGGTAAAIADPWDKASVAIKNVQETIGLALMPAINSFSTWVTSTATPAITQFIHEMQRGTGTGGDVAEALGVIRSAASSLLGILASLAPAFLAVGNVVVDVTGFFLDHLTVTKTLLGTIAALVAITKIHTAVMAVQAAGGIIPLLKSTRLVTAATRTWAAVQWVLNAALSANPIGLVIVAIAALAVAVVIAWKKSETFRRVVTGAFDAVKGAASAAFGWIKDHWPLLLAIITGPMGLAVLAVVKGWGRIKSAAQTAVRVVVNAVLWMAEKVLDAAVAAFGWAPKIGDKLKAARDKVAEFRASVNRELGGIKDERVNVTVRGITAWKGTGPSDPTLGGLVKRAKGGPINGGILGKDSVPALLTPGEHVFTEEEVKKAGGHKAIFAIRRMLRRGEFKKRGDVPAFAQGGPVFSATTSSVRGLAGPIIAERDRVARTLARSVLAQVRAILKRLGGEGKLSVAQIARGQRFARSQVGKPYVWSGVGPGGYDCSGFVSAVLNAALGMNPYRRRGSTSTMPWPGFKPGKGSFTAGWFTGSPGHMAGRIGGLGIESAGGVGVRVGNAATSVFSFPHIAHYDKGTEFVPRTGLAVLHKGEAVRPAGSGLPKRVILRVGARDFVAYVEEIADGRIEAADELAWQGA